MCRKKYNYEILDADGKVIAGGFHCNNLKYIHQTFEDMKPTAKKLEIYPDGK